MSAEREESVAIEAERAEAGPIPRAVAERLIEVGAACRSER